MQGLDELPRKELHRSRSVPVAAEPALQLSLSLGDSDEEIEAPGPCSDKGTRSTLVTPMYVHCLAAQLHNVIQHSTT